MFHTIAVRSILRGAFTAHVVLCAARVEAADWAFWRGPSQDGVSYEKGLPSSCREVLWRAPFGGRSTPVIVAKSGADIWRQAVGRIGKGSPVWADGKIYVTTAEGRFTILEDTGPKAKQLDKITFRQEGGGTPEMFGSPAVSDGRVVFFTSRELICLGHDPKPQTVSVPALPPEAPADPKAQPALVEIRPAEVLLQPGQAVRFQAVAFDSLGRPLKPVEVKWSYSGPGGSAADASVSGPGTRPVSPRARGGSGPCCRPIRPAFTPSGSPPWP